MMNKILFDIYGITDTATLCKQFGDRYSLTVLVERSFISLGSRLNLDGERLVYHIFLTTGEHGLVTKYFTTSFESLRNELLEGKTYADLEATMSCPEITDLYSFLSKLSIVGCIAPFSHPLNVDEVFNKINAGEVISLYLDGSKYSLNEHTGFSSLVFAPSDKLHSELELTPSEVAGIVDVYNRIPHRPTSRFLKISKEDCSSVLGIYHYPPTTVNLPTEEYLGVGKTYRLNNHKVITLSKMVSTALGKIYWITLDGLLYTLDGERIFKRDGDTPHSKSMFNISHELTDKK